MRAILCAALAAALCVPALASQAVYKNGGLTITLLKSECSVPQIAQALKDAGATMPAALAIVSDHGSNTLACWAVYEDKVLIGDVLGNAGFVLMKDFKEDLGV